MPGWRAPPQKKVAEPETTLDFGKEADTVQALIEADAPRIREVRQSGEERERVAESAATPLDRKYLAEVCTGVRGRRAGTTARSVAPSREWILMLTRVTHRTNGPDREASHERTCSAALVVATPRCRAWCI